MKTIFARYWKTIIVAIIIVFITAVLAWFIDNKFEDNSLSLQTLTSVASLLTSILLFSAVWTLHQRYNASQQTIDKKSEKVLGLVQLLQSVSLTIRYFQEKPELGNEIFNIRPTRDKQKKTINDSIFGNKDIKNRHYFHQDVMELYGEIVAQSTDIFMPASIAKIIRDRFDIKDMFAMETEELKNIKNNDLIIYASRIPDSKMALYVNMIDNPQETAKKVVARYNNVFVSADNIITSLCDIHREATKWLKKNSPYVLDDLNIE